MCMCALGDVVAEHAPPHFLSHEARPALRVHREPLQKGRGAQGTAERASPLYLPPPPPPTPSLPPGAGLQKDIEVAFAYLHLGSMEERADLVLAPGLLVRIGPCLPAKSSLIVRAQGTPHALLGISGCPATLSQILPRHLWGGCHTDQS